MLSALGLCDGLHTFFNGIGVYLLSLCAATQLTTSWRRVWTVALLFTATSTQIPGVIAVLQRNTASQPNPSVNRRTADQLEQATAGFRIFAPAGLPLPLAQMLRDDDRLMPDFYDGLSNAFDPSAETRKLAEMRDTTYVLLPEANTALVLLPDNRRRARALRLGYSYPLRHAPFLPLLGLRADVLAHATPVHVAWAQPGFQLYRLSHNQPH